MSHSNIWAPWRMQYLRDLTRRADGVRDADVIPEQAEDGGTFLRTYWERPEDDHTNHVIYRNARGMVLLNRYPYANGHLLVALGDGRPRLLDYSPDERAALWRLVDLAADLMERTVNPQGINMGMNQGDAAGAGVPGHLHAHLVPRWNGDTNFLMVVGAVRVIPDSLDRMADEYRLVLGRDGLSTD